MIQNNAIKKCLLIIPKSFYSYTEYIRQEFSNLGYEVIVGNHEYPDSMIGKIMGKFKIPLLLATTKKYFEQNFLSDAKYDIVLIIKGRGMSTSLISSLSKSSRKIVGYNFDSFEYNPAPIKWYKSVTKYYTFDYRDAERYSLPIVELFTSLPENMNTKLIKYDVSAIVRNHSDRLKFIDRVFTTLNVNNKFIYIYEQNIFTLLQNFFSNPILYIKYRKYISFKSLNYKEYTDVLYNSDFTLDCVHPTQSGISIRCFEALSSQTKVITNNPYISKFQHFNENNSIILTPSTKSDLFKSQFKNLQKNIPDKHRRTITTFLNELIS